MKKQYTAPEIFFEDFTLSQSIAGGCESIVNNASKGNCAVLGSGNIGVFTDGINGCDYDPKDLPGGKEDQWNGFCYHVPTDANNLFNS